METSIINSMCRCCATEGAFKHVKTSYTWMGEEEIYADMLRECFDIILTTSEGGEEGGICEVCITQLRNAANFKKQVLNTEEQFKRYSENKYFKPNVVKIELQGPDEDSDDNNLSPEEGFSGVEFDVPIKTESEETNSRKRAAADGASTSRTKRSKTKAGESSTKRIQEEKMIEIEIDVENPLMKPTINETKDMVLKNQNNLTQILLSSNATPLLRQADIGFFCHFCNEHFQDPANLKRHNLDVHDNDECRNTIVSTLDNRKWVKLDITNLLCKLCNKNMNSLDDLYRHLKEHHELPIFTDMKQLIIPFSFNNSVMRCCICLTIFGKFKKMMEHMHVHYKNYICEQCDLGFITSLVLAKHTQTHNKGTFACNFCSNIYDTLSKRRYHEKFSHIQVNTYKYNCGYCVERFAESHQKDVHLAKVHGVPSNLTCSACPKTFNSKKYLTKHMRREHLMDQKFQCPDCDMRFVSFGELNRHSVKHSGIKEFQCDVCFKFFGRKSTLKKHAIIHTKERKYKCEHCGQGFTQKYNWTSHMKNKHGDIM